jgi:hypothetical protein
MNGYVLDRARELGIDAPAMAAIVEAMLAVDAGEVKPSRAVIDNVLARAGIAVPAAGTL